MEIKEFQKLVLKKAKEAGFEDCEIYYQGGDSFQILINEGKVEHYEKSTASGAAFRGVINGKTGLAYSERMDERAADFMVRAAAENAEIAEKDDTSEFYAGGKYAELSLYNKELDKVTAEDKIMKAKQAEKAALDFSDNIKSADRCIYADENSRVSIMNTKGLAAEYSANSMAAFVSVISEKGGDIKTGGEFFAGNDFGEFEPNELGKKAALEADSMLGAKPVKSGIYNVIFKNTAMASILSVFSGSFTGEQAYKGLSMLSGREGQKIASDCVTIKDDGLLEGGYATAVFDGEGVPCQNKTIVENGVLKTLLYDLKYASKMGKLSTGNGFRAGFKSPVVCACTNFYICPSDKPFDELVKKMGDGIYITNVEGLHAGANPVSGDFSLSAEGFLIENGNIVSPVEQITAASNFFKLLESIKDVGNDLRFNMGGIGSPAVLVENINISGL